MKKSLSIVEWIICIAVGITFLLAASGKFSFEGNMYENFIKWGYSGALLITVGIMEATGGIMLFMPFTRKYGSIILSVVMIGSIFTHIRNPEMGSPLLPVVLLILLTVIFLFDLSKENVVKTVNSTNNNQKSI